jgi:hypothetical protein
MQSAASQGTLRRPHVPSPWTLAPGRRFRIALVVLAAAAFACSFAELVQQAQQGVIFSLLFAAWCTSPVLFWLGWGLVVADEGRAFRIAVTVVGAFVVPAVVGFQLLIAASSSSTAGMGFFTVPFPLLVATAVAAVCANGLAALHGDARREGGRDDEWQLLDEFRRRTDGLGSR